MNREDKLRDVEDNLKYLHNNPCSTKIVAMTRDRGFPEFFRWIAYENPYWYTGNTPGKEYNAKYESQTQKGGHAKYSTVKKEDRELASRDGQDIERNAYHERLSLKEVIHKFGSAVCAKNELTLKYVVSPL